MSSEDKKTGVPLTAAPLDWNPSIIDALHGPTMKEGTAEARAVFAAGTTALTDLCMTYAGINAAQRAAVAAAPPVVADSTDAAMKALLASAQKQIETGRERGLGLAMDQALNRLGPRIEKSLARIRAGRQALEKELQRAMVGPSEGRHAHEIRSHFSGNAKRVIEVIRNGSEADARQTCAAMLRDVPTFLQPFDEEKMKQVREAAAERFAPALAAQLKAAVAIEKRVTDSQASFSKKFVAMKPRKTKSSEADTLIERLASGQ